MAEQFRTTKQAAQEWGVPLSTVQWWAKKGNIPGAFKVGRAWLIPASVDLRDVKRGRPGRPKRDE